MFTLPPGHLQTIAILGEGAFGLVKLVRLKATGETYALFLHSISFLFEVAARACPVSRFALKCMQKARIVSNNQQKNVVTEKNLLAEVRTQFFGRCCFISSVTPAN